jgi:hypothetical protein
VVGEITTLAHELGNHTVERGTLVAEALLARAQSTEVLWIKRTGSKHNNNNTNTQENRRQFTESKQKKKIIMSATAERGSRQPQCGGRVAKG